MILLLTTRNSQLICGLSVFGFSTARFLLTYAANDSKSGEESAYAAELVDEALVEILDCRRLVEQRRPDDAQSSVVPRGHGNDPG